MAEALPVQKAFLSIRKLSLKNSNGQGGMVLMMMLFIVGLAAITYLVHALNSSDIQNARDQKTALVLSDAKAALIAWAVNHPDQPGLMPYPDRNGDGNYDGDSDCSTVAFNYSFLLGKLPWRAADNANCASLISGMGDNLKDGSGESLWYVVSRNLVYDYPNSQYPVINPGMINSPNNATAPYQRQGGTTAYPWITVYDKDGNLVSDRVAAVIIAPGAPMENQDRSGSAPAASNFLDNFTLQAGGGIKSNATYAMSDEDFFMGEDSRSVRSDDTYQQPYYFNDKLIYITIDELMVEVTKRVAGEVATKLKAYSASNGHFPYAAPLGASSGYSCADGQLSGMLPTDSGAGGPSCSCTLGSSPYSCSCSFSSISNVSFKRSGTSTWSATNVSGACTRTATQVCTCTGTGHCYNTTGSRNFTCDSAGNCTTNAAGTYTFTGAFTGASVNTATGGCSVCGSTVTCNTGTSAGTFSAAACSDTALSALPAWFSANKWQDYFFYQLSRSSPTMTAGSRANIQSLLVATGKPIISPYAAASKGSNQIQPSCSINDYLDSTENANADLVFDAPNTARSNQYNDQVFIVAP